MYRVAMFFLKIHLKFSDLLLDSYNIEARFILTYTELPVVIDCNTNHRCVIMCRNFMPP